jgi:hypothetical protein
MRNHTTSVLVTLLQRLLVGTNLALFHFMGMMVSGARLPNRGAMFPALKATGLSDAAIRRAWVAFRKGTWQIDVLLHLWREYVMGLKGWQEHRYEGYVPVTVDITVFWRLSCS